MKYFLIIKGQFSRIVAEQLVFRWLDDPFPNEDGICIYQVGWITDWDYTKITLDSNTIEPAMLESRLNSWLTDITEPPFPHGSLLWWTKNEQ